MRGGSLAMGWWGYAVGNPTVVGIVVAVIAVAAIAFVVRRMWRR